MIVFMTMLEFMWNFSMFDSIYAERQSSTRIIGGEPCSIEQYPFAVSLRSTNKLIHFCGGSLIKPQWVLTAAHCTLNKVKQPEKLTCMVGLSEVHRSMVQAITAQKIYVHEKYKHPTVYHDISLVSLERPAILFDIVGLIRTPPIGLTRDDSDKLSNCKTGKIIGWGSLQAWDPVEQDKPKMEVSHLTCVEVNIMSIKECFEYTNGKANEYVLCTLIANDTRDSCQGDSGGALFCDNVQIGIIATGHGCGIKGNIAYYTNLAQYTDFIHKVVSEGVSVKMELTFFCILCFTFSIRFL